jgi:hypothetical protein
VACQLSIKHNIADDDHFSTRQVEQFEHGPITVGRAPDCDCHVDAPDFAEFHFTVLERDRSWFLLPRPGTAAYLNNAPVESATEVPLNSGDVIRVGHWTLQFYIVHGNVGQGRRADWMARLAKTLVGLIVFSEIFIVVWLPHKLHNAALWKQEVAKQRSLMLLDNLRGLSNKLAQEESLTGSGAQLISSELDNMARHLRQYQDKVTPQQWQDYYREFSRYEKILNSLHTGKAVPPLPALDLNAGISRILERPTPHKDSKP